MNFVHLPSLEIALFSHISDQAEVQATLTHSLVGLIIH